MLSHIFTIIILCLSLFPTQTTATSCAQIPSDYSLCLPADYGQHLELSLDEWRFIALLKDNDNNTYMTHSRITMYSPGCNYPTNTTITFVSTFTDVSKNVMFYQQSTLQPNSDMTFASNPVNITIDTENYYVHNVYEDVYEFSTIVVGAITSNFSVLVQLLTVDNLLISEAGNQSVQHFVNAYGIEFSQSTLTPLVGQVINNGKYIQVVGNLLSNHLFMTPPQIVTVPVWTYLVFQYDNGYNLHVFMPRNHDGGYAPESYISLSHPNGTSIYLRIGMQGFTFIEDSKWLSPITQRIYFRVHYIELHDTRINITCNVLIDDNEILTPDIYYEGGSTSQITLSNGDTYSGYGITSSGGLMRPI
jgi:predicted secreted hydrolase